MPKDAPVASRADGGGDGRGGRVQLGVAGSRSKSRSRRGGGPAECSTKTKGDMQTEVAVLQCARHRHYKRSANTLCNHQHMGMTVACSVQRRRA